MNRNDQNVRGVSRERGMSRSRTASRLRSGYTGPRNAEGSSRRTTSAKRAGSGYSYNSGSSGNNYDKRHDDEHSGRGFLIGGIAIAAVLVAGLGFLAKNTIFSARADATETTSMGAGAEETSAQFDPNVIRTDLYLDYSQISPDAKLLNMNGMDREQVENALKAAYTWNLIIVNANPSIDSFKMPELPKESDAASAKGSSDDEGTEEVTQVDNPLAKVTIRPEKTQYSVPDLIGEDIDSYVDQIFKDYESKGAEQLTKKAEETTKAAETGTQGSSESTAESSETTKTASADYVLELPDMSEQITDYVTQLAAVWKMDPENGDITKYDSSSGEFAFGGSVNGYAVNVKDTASKVMDAIKSGSYDQQVKTEGEVVSASSTSIKDQYDTIGSYQTETTSNSVRNGNIKLAAAAINGTILRPGEEFSFNNTVGQRTEAKGYGAAAAYNNGEVVQEVGGGVCQVSTTLYNAVFRSGLTTTYRRSHTFAPNYVTPGMDATVSWPGPDYRFVNNSSHNIGIRAWYSDQTVTVQIYGVRVLPKGVKWSLTSEKVKDLPMPNPVVITSGDTSKGSQGSEWQAYKIITNADGSTEKVKDHYTTYKGHTPKVYASAQATTAASGSAAETTKAAAAQETHAGGESAAGGPSSETSAAKATEKAATEPKKTETTAQETTEKAEIVEAPTVSSNTGDSDEIDAPVNEGGAIISDGPGGV